MREEIRGTSISRKVGRRICTRRRKRHIMKPYGRKCRRHLRDVAFEKFAESSRRDAAGIYRVSRRLNPPKLTFLSQGRASRAFAILGFAPRNYARPAMEISIGGFAVFREQNRGINTRCGESTKSPEKVTLRNEQAAGDVNER